MSLENDKIDDSDVGEWDKIPLRRHAEAMWDALDIIAHLDELLDKREWPDDGRIGKVARQIAAATIKPGHHKITMRKYPEIEGFMDSMNYLLKAYGVEAIWLDDNNRTLGKNPDAVYLNMGDMYRPTILFDFRTRRLRRMSPGDYIERYERTESA